MISGCNKNIQIVSGSLMSAGGGSPDNYTFTYIDFSKTEIVMWKEDLTNSTKYGGSNGNNYLDLRYALNGKNSMIVMHRIGETGVGIVPVMSSSSNSSASASTGEAPANFVPVRNSLKVVNTTMEKTYADYATGIQTPAGSIIPQPIVPSDDYVGYDNGVYFGSYAGQKSFTSHGYNWSAYQTTAYNSNNSAVVAYANSIKSYGIHQDQGYVSNEQSRNAVLDFPVILKRRYICNVESSYSGKGACVICYKFCTFNLVGQGSTPEEKEDCPLIRVVLDAAVMTSASSASTPNNSSASFSGGIEILIPPDNQITVAANIYKNQGALSMPGNDLLPPQSKFINGQGYTTIPLFIYPLYTGLVVTNSIIKNKKNRSEEIFVRFPNKTDPRYDTQLGGVSPSAQITSYMSGDSGGNMKWFPTLFQECSAKKNIALTVVAKDQVKFGSTVDITFSKATGNFAYCPLYFYRNLQFTLLFKGQYNKAVSSSNTGSNSSQITTITRTNNFDYYLFPLVCTNDVTNSSGWSGTLSSAGAASCVVISGGTSATGGMASGSNGLVCNDDYMQQSIYRAKFKFTSDKLLRYPLQVFGAVVAMYRKSLPFPVKKNNGKFKLSSSAHNFGNYASCVGSQVPSGTGYFYNLITGCQVQCGMEGASGRLTLDGYLLNSLQYFKREQFIGEIDLDVKNQGNLFKGFGMEITTENQQNNYNIGVNLAGTQKKLQDMKLVCAPFWDGDRLQAICNYFQNYCNVKIKMINHACSSFENAKQINYTGGIFSSAGNWISNKTNAIGNTTIKSTDFRVGRSWSWESPHINFPTGTSCLEALNKLATDTSCIFTVGLDGVGYFYELNDFGYPYYVDSQTSSVEFDLSDLSSISLTPSIVNKYNSIATLGFIVKKNNDGTIDNNSIATATQPGFMYTKIDDDSKYAGKTLFPWTRHNVGIEQGYLTKVQLHNLHRNRVLFSISDVYTGSITVRGNLDVTHLYQKIKVGGIPFFVNSIDHNLDLQKKSWTTTYGITYQNISSSSSAK